MAHASFFVASVFGIVTFSAIIQQLNEKNATPIWMSMVLFLGLAYTGYFTLARFNYYADLAEKLATEGLKQRDIMKKIKMTSKPNIKNLDEYFKEKTRKEGDYLLLKKLLYSGRWSDLALGVGYWAGIFFLGFIVYERFRVAILGLSIETMFDVLFAVILLVVILPVAITTIHERAKVPKKRRQVLNPRLR